MSTSNSYHQVNGFGNMVGRSPAMRVVYEMLTKVAASNSTVLITGPSGVGKELAAEAIHALSPRRARPLVTVNCSALPENLIESELFGHCKGAFTGANTDRLGRFQQAAGGTLFLDEVGELGLALQVKLLRVIQFKTFERVGENTSTRADVRVVAATHRDLKQGVAEGWFRQDLYYRLNVVPIALPRLADRHGDVALLADHFLNRYAAERGGDPPVLTAAAMGVLERYPFPGNIRELENIIQRAVILCGTASIDVNELPAEVRRHPGTGAIIGNPCAVDNKTLSNALQNAVIHTKNGEIVLWHRHLRCIGSAAIAQFLLARGRNWFSRKCFARFLEARTADDRSKYKTAGVFLTILLANQVCVHNGKKANRSAYRLHSRFFSPSDAADGHGRPAFERRVVGL